MKLQMMFVAGLVLAAAPAHARCSGNNYPINLNQTSNAVKITDGSPCYFKVIGSRFPIYGTDIVSQPKHGRVAISGRTTVIYTPTPGYHGEDSFAYQWVGRDTGAPGAARIEARITVN